jgi:hypothetical protein
MNLIITLVLLLSTPVSPPEKLDGKRAKVIAKKQLSTFKSPKTLPEPGVLPLLGAVIPGLIYPAGHLVMGDTIGHGRIIAMKGTGVGFLILGMVPLFLTNASPKIIHLPVYSLLTGFSLFSIATFADIYGSIFSGNPSGTPLATIPYWEVRSGYRYIKDYLIDNAHSAVIGGRINHGRFQVKFDASFTPPSSNWMVNLFGGYRFLGDEKHIKQDGSFLEGSGGITYRRYKTEKFTTLTSELFLLGRLDMHKVHPTLKGSFAEIGGGAALRFVGYDTLGNHLNEDWELIPLFRFTYGFYIGKGQGEVKVIYDHRHDDELGGLAMGGSGGDGVIGHFGIEGTWWFSSRWGVHTLVAGGSSQLYLVSLIAKGEK